MAANSLASAGRLVARSLAVLSLACLAAVAVAQEPPPDVNQPKHDAAADSGELTAPQDQLPGEVKPEVYYLKDKNGRLQAVPGLSFEKLMELIRLKNGLGPEEDRPPYSIERIDVKGTASADRAELSIRYKIALRKNGWIRVRLRVPSAVLHNYEGQGEWFLHYDDDEQGYSAWIKSPNDDHESDITLHAAVPLVAPGGETRLALSLPRAAVGQVELEVPAAGVKATVSENATLDSVNAKRPGTTLLSASGAVGDFEIAWRKEEAATPAAAPVLEASALQVVTIDAGRVTTEARLSVRSFGGQFDNFQVRLPAMAEWDASNQPGVAVSQVEEAEGQARLLDVRLPRRTSGPVEVRLVSRRERGEVTGEEDLELSGFEVVGATRQSGFVAVRVLDNWQVRWGRRLAVRQVEDVPEAARRDDAVAYFEFRQQPYGLAVTLARKIARVNVSPEYVCLVGPDDVTLSGILRYTVRGAKVRSLLVDLAGWDLDDVGPASVVNIESVVVTGSVLWIPLTQPTAGDVEITLHLRRAADRATGRVEFEFPRPEAASVARAAIVIESADNVELTTDMTAMVALDPQPLRTSIKLPTRQQEPLSYQGSAARSRFCAEYTIHPQAVSVELATSVSMDEKDVRVQQRLAYQVLHEPLDRLQFDLPSAVSAGNVQASIDGQKMSVVARRATEQSERASVVPHQIALVAPRIGRFELVLAYTLPQERLLTDTTTRTLVPLAAPREAKVQKHRAVVAARPGLTLLPVKGLWSADNSPRTSEGGGTTISLVATTPQTAIELALTPNEQASAGTAMVDRAWIQSWLSDSARQDRAVFRLVSADRSMRVTLPKGVLENAVEVLLDGSRLALAAQRDGSVLVPLPATGGRKVHILDLRYRFAERPARGKLQLSPPTLPPAIWSGQTYWQVILPSDEHLLSSPDRWTNEFSWNWSGLFWQRAPHLEERELETWVGSKGVTAAAGGNRYLFSTVGQVADFSPRTSSRTLLVFSASLVCLGVGLALIYVPAIRSPATLFVAAVVLGALAAIEPETSLVIGQAALLGLALAGVACLLAVRSRHRTTSKSTVRGSSLVYPDRSPTEVRHAALRSGSLTSTATAPMALQGSSQEIRP